MALSQGFHYYGKNGFHRGVVPEEMFYATRKIVPTETGSDYDFYGATKGAGAGDTYEWYRNFDNLDPSWVNSNAAGAGSNTGASGGLKDAFAKWKGKASGFGDKAAGLINPDNYGWSKKGGLKAFGKNIGKWGNIASGVMQGVDAAQGIGDYMDTVNSNEDLMSKIQVSAMGNPLLSSYLTSDQLNLLGDIQLGNYGTEADAGDFLKGAVGGIGDAIIPTLSGLAIGGIPGAVIGGVGTLINSGIDGTTAAAGQNTAELQALYQALQDAEMQYKSMKRPNFTGLGIQQQYQNMYA